MPIECLFWWKEGHILGKISDFQALKWRALELNSNTNIFCNRAHKAAMRTQGDWMPCVLFGYEKDHHHSAHNNGAIPVHLWAQPAEYSSAFLSKPDDGPKKPP